MDKQCMCGDPTCDGCESITLFRGYEAEYVEGLKAELARKDAWIEKATEVLKEVAIYSNKYHSFGPLRNITINSELIEQAQALLAEMREGR